jgi:drug/metabolite transporter (DMT)-like permease
MARFSPQPAGTGQIFPIASSLVAKIHPVFVSPCFSHSEKSAPVAAALFVLTGPSSSVIALGLSAAVFWGVSDFLGGVAARAISSILVVAIAHSLSFLVLILAALATHAAFPSEHAAAWAVATGFSGGLALILFYRALALGEMGLTAAWTGLLTALVPVVVSWLTEGRPKNTQLTGFVIATAAICLIAYEPRGKPRQEGLGLATAAGLGFGLFLVASKYASREAVLLPLAYARLSSASLAIGVLLALRAKNGRGALKPEAPEEDAPAAEKKGWGGIILLAGAAGTLDAAGNMFYMRSTGAGRLDVAAILSSLYPAATILLAMWVLKERATRSKALGMVLALAAVVIISL